MRNTISCRIFQLFLPIQVTPSSTVSILWLIPQFFVLTVAELFFSVTGMHFTYMEVSLYNTWNFHWILIFVFIKSPARLRTFLQAAWLFTGSIGNTIVIAVAETNSLPRPV